MGRNYDGDEDEWEGLATSLSARGGIFGQWEQSVLERGVDSSWTNARGQHHGAFRGSDRTSCTVDTPTVLEMGPGCPGTYSSALVLRLKLSWINFISSSFIVSTHHRPSLQQYSPNAAILAPSHEPKPPRPKVICEKCDLGDSAVISVATELLKKQA